MGAFRIGTEAAEPVEREHNQAALAIAAAVVGLLIGIFATGLSRRVGAG